MSRIPVDRAQLEAFCQRYHIRRLALFGSVLGNDFRPESDVDVLVEFEPGCTPGFLALATMEHELSPILGGRTVDLQTPKFEPILPRRSDASRRRAICSILT